jgi:hypothetical protein
MKTRPTSILAATLLLLASTADAGSGLVPHEPIMASAVNNCHQICASRCNGTKNKCYSNCRQQCR